MPVTISAAPSAVDVAGAEVNPGQERWIIGKKAADFLGVPTLENLHVRTSAGTRRDQRIDEAIAVDVAGGRA